MSERCPLVDRAWDRDIPDFCRENCGDLWEKAEATQKPYEDLIDRDCTHLLEYEDTSLQRGRGAERFSTILSVCMVTGDDVLNETYTFTCPFN